MELKRLLVKHGACEEARVWAKPYETLPEAWAVCERGDWMLWLAARAGLCSRQELVLAACACARLALRHVKKGEKRPLTAIKTAEAWARGDAGVTLDMVRAAAAAAFAAAAAYAAAYAADAADAAYADAYAADAAAYAAAAAYADAFAAAAAYAAAFAAAAAYAKTLRRCADLVRAQAVKGAWKDVR